MKTTLLIAILIALFSNSHLIVKESDAETTNQQVATGIILDSLNNEVYLQYENGRPSYYFSKIFTPVCETGVCLPIKINIYWDLTGRYMRYDQPEGEVLTKSDHELFSKSDYRLLDEIMAGPDPRDGASLKHSQPRHGASSKGDQQSSPAPPAPSVQLKFKTAADMCDALTGSTLPQMRNKYVPGALYTSYTCWELANNSSGKMRQYTQNHLMTESFLPHLIDCKQCGTFNMAVDHISQEKKGEDSRRNTLLSIIDTSNQESTTIIALQAVSAYSWQKDTVQHTLTRAFTKHQQTDQFKLQLLRLWRSRRPIPMDMLNHIAKNINKDETLFYEYQYALQTNQNWSETVFSNLINALTSLEDQSKQLSLHQLMTQRVDEYSLETQDLFKTLKDK